MSSCTAQAIEAAKVARSHAMDARLKKKKPSLINTTAGLNHARVSSGASADKIMVHVQVRVKELSKRSSKSIDPSYGTWGKPWPRDAYLSGKSLTNLIRQANLSQRFSIILLSQPMDYGGKTIQYLSSGLYIDCPKFEKIELTTDHIHRNEVEFRIHPNKLFITGTQNDTIAEIYNCHMTGENAPFYVPATLPKGVKGPTLFLDFVINKTAVCSSASFDNKFIKLEHQV